MDEKFVNRLCTLQKEFNHKYWNTGLVSIAENYIQLEDEEFANQFGDLEYEVINRQDKNCPYEVQIRYKGVQFLAVGTKEGFENCGLI